MADSAWVPSLAADVAASTTAPRHSANVRVTHWTVTLAFFALLLSGIEILISHPRFYWGEVGNVLTPSLFDLPIPASRSAVKTGYNYVLPDQNGWSRDLHFQSAWIAVLTGIFYFLAGLLTGHFRKNLLPSVADLRWSSFSKVVANHLRFKRSAESAAWSYNALQRIAYLGVIFVLFPFMIWTGLAMSPSIASAFPATMSVFGGQQSARTLHFFGTVLFLLFLLIHVVMVCLAGFKNRMRAMITGHTGVAKERS